MCTLHSLFGLHELSDTYLVRTLSHRRPRHQIPHRRRPCNRPVQPLRPPFACLQVLRERDLRLLVESRAYLTHPSRDVLAPRRSRRDLRQQRDELPYLRWRNQSKARRRREQPATIADIALARGLHTHPCHTHTPIIGNVRAVTYPLTRLLNHADNLPHANQFRRPRIRLHVPDPHAHRMPQSRYSPHHIPHPSRPIPPPAPNLQPGSRGRAGRPSRMKTRA